LAKLPQAINLFRNSKFKEALMNQKKNPQLRRTLGSMLALTITIQLFLPGTVLSHTDQGRMVGTVHDQNKASVPGAKVTVKNGQTGEERSALTNEEGSYLITNLKASAYNVRVSAQGFADSEVKGIQILVSQALTLDMELRPAGTTEVVNVAAGEDAGLDTTSARIGANVNPREVQGLPLNGRQLSQLYLQAPGSLNSGSGTFGDIRFSGRAVEQNAVRYDGVEGSAIIDSSPGNLNGEIASPFRLQASLENVRNSASIQTATLQNTALARVVRLTWSPNREAIIFMARCLSIFATRNWTRETGSTATSNRR